MKTETIAIHAGNLTDSTSGAVIQPITLSTTYQRGEDGGYPGGYIYTRMNNPNRASLEKVMTLLECGVDACAFASGNAAAGALFQSLEPGSHIIAPDDMYHGLRAQLQQVHSSLQVDFVDLSDINKLTDAIKANTRLIWIETPSNPLLKISDIRAIADLGKKHNITVACDNTFASPIFQKPLELGCDIVMHSATKYLGGHSDVLGGILVTKEDDELWTKVRSVQILSGAVPAPFDCYLIVRGLKTLPYRMRGHHENAMLIASFLEKHHQVEKVFYPGLPSHPGSGIAAAQMTGFGGTLSFCVKGDAAAARLVANAVRLFAQATSLGGVESLIEHRASLEGPDTKTPDNLLRISVGLEHADDLISDLQQALAFLE